MTKRTSTLERQVGFAHRTFSHESWASHSDLPHSRRTSRGHQSTPHLLHVTTGHSVSRPSVGTPRAYDSQLFNKSIKSGTRWLVYSVGKRRHPGKPVPSLTLQLVLFFSKDSVGRISESLSSILCKHPWQHNYQQSTDNVCPGCVCHK